MAWNELSHRRLSETGKEQFAQNWIRDRELARTDLIFLCGLLDFKDVQKKAHGAIIDNLQKFSGYYEAINPKNFRLIASRPRVPLWDLEGPRKHLLLYPRGGLKTSVNSIAHSIQWILNYPNIRILVTTATEKLAKQIMEGIASSFETNEKIRFLFPEFCAKPGKQLGNQEKFTIPNRTSVSIKEPTVSLITVDSAMAGPHYEVIKHSDVIDEFNSKTPNGLDTIRTHFKMCLPLVERNQDSKGRAQRGWRTIEGTIYDFSDFHAELLDKLKDVPTKKSGWVVTVRSCWADKAKTKSYWPERYSVQDLRETCEEMGTELFANQYELEAIPEGSGLTTKERLSKLWIPRKVLNAILPTLALHATIDLAGLEKISVGDYTVITLAGFDNYGRMYILEVHRDHFDGHEVTDIMLDMDSRYNGRIRDFKIEKEGHAVGLKSTIEIKQALSGRVLIIDLLKRDTQISKVNRIKNGLKFWFSSGRIRFAEDLTCKKEIEDEILRFPKWRYDDILDTFADQTQNSVSGYEPDSIPTPKKEIQGPYCPPPFRGFDERGEAMWGDKELSVSKHYDENTGL